jgi:hypothetical protein
MTIHKAIAKVSAVLVSDHATRRATYYLSPTMAVKATRQRRMNGRSIRDTFLVTVGRPNFIERRFIGVCQKAGESFPVKKVQIKFWPKR